MLFPELSFIVEQCHFKKVDKINKKIYIYYDYIFNKIR